MHKSGRAGALAIGAAAGLAIAGGSGDNIVIIADPLNPESMYAANYYKAARQVPDSNVIYIHPGADDYQAFVDFNLAALQSLIAERGLEGQADFVLLMPGAPFYIDAPGLVTDQCFEVTRFSISAAYTTAFITDNVLAGVPSSFGNRYARNSFVPLAFDSEITWWAGEPSNREDAERYYIGCMLGYTGERGNTLGEILDNVDRSVAADYTRPAGTFYFMHTTDDPRSSPRHNSFPNVVAQIQSLGGSAEEQFRFLPQGEDDCLSVLTGKATLDLDNANIGLLAGSYCDHLTSWAAMFDNPDQTKVSAWIRKGATATWGTVEEPCNYPGKFTHARSMAYYYQGLSMGESIFRAVGFTPFQGLMYGDPLCRPFDYPVTVEVDDAPTGPVAGEISITPVGSTERPFGLVRDFDVTIDNRRVARDFRVPITIDTTELEDGWHEFAVLGFDLADVRSVGSFRQGLVVSNLGRSAAISTSVAFGSQATRFSFDVSSMGGGVGGAPVEIRLVHNGRVLDAAPGCAATLETTGLQLGAGVSALHAEALFADGMHVRSAPLDVEVLYETGTPSGQAPGTATYSRWAGGQERVLVELPSTHDDATDTPAFQIVDPPAQATMIAGPAGPYRLLEPDPNATGFDVMTYRATNADGQSTLGRVVIVYDRHPTDVNGDGDLDIDDLHAINQSPVDLNFDGVADASDISLLMRLIRCGERSEPRTD